MNVIDKTLPAYLKIRKSVIEQLGNLNDLDEKLPSVQELCDIHHVSRPTVVKAMKTLADDGYIITRRGLGMFPNPDRQGKRYGGNVGVPEGTIGLVACNGTVSTYDTALLKMMSGVANVLSCAGYYLRPVNITSQKDDILKELKPLNLDGLLWLRPHKTSMPLIQNIDNSGFPLVSVSWHEQLRGKHYVSTNFSDCGFNGISHLLSLGHRDILYPCLPNKNCNGLEVEGMKRAYKEYGVPSDHLRIIPCQSNPTDKVEALIDAGLKFTAVTTSTEYYQYLMDLFARKGLNVPADISIITDEELSTQNLKNPPPTLLSIPYSDMGNAAAKGLINILKDHQEKPLNIIMQTKFIEGATTMSLKRSLDNTIYAQKDRI